MTLEAAEQAHDRAAAAERAWQDAMADGVITAAEARRCYGMMVAAVTDARRVVQLAERADIAQLAAVSMLSGGINQYTARRMEATGLEYQEPMDAA